MDAGLRRHDGVEWPESHCRSWLVLETRPEGWVADAHRDGVGVAECAALFRPTGWGGANAHGLS